MKGFFITYFVGNLDSNQIVTRAKTSFHGRGMSLFQNHSNENKGDPNVKHKQLKWFELMKGSIQNMVYIQDTCSQKNGKMLILQPEDMRLLFKVHKS